MEKRRQETDVRSPLHQTVLKTNLLSGVEGLSLLLTSDF